jgi:hypothetical protein
LPAPGAAEKIFVSVALLFGLYGRPVQFDLERMNFAAHGLELLVIMSRQGLVTLFFQFLDPRFHHGSVGPFGVMMRESVNVESLADRGDQMLLVELRAPFDCVVFYACGDLAQLSHGLLLQFLVGALSHDSTILSGFQLARLERISDQYAC